MTTEKGQSNAPPASRCCAIWQDASIWPEPEIDLLLIVDDEFVIGYFDYGIYKNDRHETVQPTFYSVIFKPTKSVCRGCNSKEAQLKCIGYQLEKGIKAVEAFLANGSLPYTEGFWKLVEPLQDFVVQAKEELKLWEDKK